MSVSQARRSWCEVGLLGDFVLARQRKVLPGTGGFRTGRRKRLKQKQQLVFWLERSVFIWQCEE